MMNDKDRFIAILGENVNLRAEIAKLRAENARLREAAREMLAEIQNYQRMTGTPDANLHRWRAALAQKRGRK